MPNRILREGILTSPRISKLGWPEEVFYRRLMSVVDDFGRYYADHGLLRAACYPRQLNKVSDSDIGKWLQVIATAALVRVYPAQDGERYLQLLDFRQQARAAKSKFPQPPDECVADAAQALLTGEADAPVFVFGDVAEGGDEGEKARKRAPGFDPSGIALPDWLDRGDWGRWCADRATRKKPITEAAAALQIAKLATFMAQGHKPKDVIETSIANGWQGLFAPANNRPQGVVGSKHTGFADKDYTEGVNPDGSLV